MEYALIAIKHIDGKANGELSSVKEISAAYKAPFDATAKVMQQLVHGDILDVVHGAKGGYKLKRSLSETSFLQVAEALLGPVALVDCVYETEKDCQLFESCNVVSPMTRLNQKVKEFYANMTLEDLIGTELCEPQALVV